MEKSDKYAVTGVDIIDRLRLAGINHRYAPIELRDRLSIPMGKNRPFLRKLMRKRGMRELVAISTCNRTEFYWTADRAADPMDFFRELPQVDAELIEELSDRVYYFEGLAAVKHIFEVAASLDSLVMGETQILHQVKKAYERSQEEGFLGPTLNSAFQMCFNVAKRVRTETGLTAGKTSIPSVALELTQAIFEDLSDADVLIIGTGEMARLTLDLLRTRGALKFTFVTRTAERAATWAEEHRAEVYTMDRLEDALKKADIVVSATASQQPVLTADHMKRALAERENKNRPYLILDLAVPRNVEPEVAGLHQVFLRNVDDLQKVVERNKVKLESEAVKARNIVQQALDEFVGDCRVTTVSSTISEVRAVAQEVAEAEIKRAMNKLAHLSEKDREEINTLVHRVINKVLHPPTKTLREASKNGDSAEAVAWARKFFGIENEDNTCAAALDDSIKQNREE